jgi:hypothetical protein
VISLEDNGVAFDPLNGLDASKVNKFDHIGSYVFDSFRARFQHEVDVTYERATSSGSDFSRVSIAFKNPTRTFATKPSELSIDLSVVVGRDGAERFAATVDLPPRGTDLILNVTEYANISALVMFIHFVLDRMSKESNLVLYLPKHWLLEPLPKWISDPQLVCRFRE